MADLSTLLIPGAVGAVAVWWALSHGATSGQAMLAVGSALATVWLFSSLEQFFERGHSVSVLALPLALPLLILLAPLYPFLAWSVRGLRGVFPPDPKDVKEYMTQKQIEYEMEAWDSGDWRYPEIARQKFEPTSTEVEYNLGVSFPDGFADWITSSQDQTQKWVDESLIQVWPWSAIKEHPVEAEKALVFFADCDLDGKRGHIAIDLRDTPFKGCVVRYGLDGELPHWNLVGDPLTLAASFANWNRLIASSSARFPEPPS